MNARRSAVALAVGLITTWIAGMALAGGNVSLKTGQAHSSALPHGGEPFQTFLIRVPVDADRLVIDVDADGDADLYLKPGGPIARDWSKEAVAMARSESGKERIVLTADGIPRLRACTYYLDVVHGQGAGGKPFDFEVTVEIEASAPGGAVPLPAAERAAPGGIKVHLAVAEDFEGHLEFDPADQRFRTFAVEVASDVASVTIATTRATADIDLYARHGMPMENWQEAEYAATSRRRNERLVIARTDTAPLRSGTYYVDVAKAGDGGAAANITIRFERGYEGEEPDAAAPTPSATADVVGEVRADSSFTLEIDDAGKNYRTFLVHVPAGTHALLVRALGSRRDLDLHLRHSLPIADYNADPDHSANGTRANEQLYVTAASAPPLRSGTYYLDIFRPYGGSTGPVEVDILFNAPVPDPLPASSAPIVELVAGQRTQASAPEGSKTTRFTVDIPVGATSLHVGVFHATRDMDLFLRYGAEITEYNDTSGHDHSGTSMLLNEQLTIDGSSTPPLRSGRYYIDAVSLIGKDEQIAFEIATSIDEPVAVLDSDLEFPPYQRLVEPNDLERALEATVGVMSENGMGSGTCLSPGGYILTNHHVLEEEGMLVEDDIYVSFVHEFDAPPDQVFVARLVDVAKEVDLALIRVDRDVFDRPVPEDLNLPFLPPGDPSDLRLGDSLYVAGYPTVGGFESRTSLSVVRGIVSGFVTDLDGDLVWIKTDARINQGNSGGAALTGDGWHFVGVPSMEAVDEDDELGYCRPVSRIPEAWLELLRADTP